MHTQIIWHHCVSTGGITTLVDMPLNSFPSTVSQETLKLKVWIEKQQSITLFWIKKKLLVFLLLHSCTTQRQLFFEPLVPTPHPP